jgi:hypothetical protein
VSIDPKGLKKLFSSPTGWQKILPAGLYLLGVTAGLSIAFRNWAYDDPYITYRYAENIVHGLGMVYNPGERLLSTTTPLFTLLLAFLRLFSANLHDLAIGIGAFSLGVGGLCLWDLANCSGLRLGRWAVLLFYPTFPLLVTTLSAETCLYIALCLGTVACYQRARYNLAALTAALAVLTRPDALVLTGTLIIHFLYSQRMNIRLFRQELSRLPWQAAGIFCLVLLPWVIFAWFYFGSPVPTTLFAKQQQASLQDTVSFVPGLLTILSQFRGWNYLITALLALVGVISSLRLLPALHWLTAWAVLYFITFGILEVPSYSWYYAPLVPAFILAFAAGLDRLPGFLQDLQRKLFDGENQPFQMTIRYFPPLLLLLLLSAQLAHLWQVRLTPDTRFPIYHAAGQWLRLHSMPGSTVGTLEVGIIGYTSGLPMIDFSGLIQPEIAIQLEQTGSYAATANQAFHRYHPDFLVLQRGLFPELEASAATARCQQMVTFPGQDYGYAFDLEIISCP